MQRKREALDTTNEAAYATRGVRLLQEASRAATAPVDAIVETGSNAKRQRLGPPKEEGKEHEVSAVSAVDSGDSVVGAVAVASERDDETWDAGAFRNEIDELRRKNDYLAQEIDALRQHITNRDESSAFVDARDGRLAMIDEHDAHRTVHAYQERLRSGLKLIQDSLSKMEESLKNTDASRSPENRTTQELQTFHAECNRQMTALLRRLDDVTSPPVTETGMEHKEPEPSAYEQGDVYQMHLASVEPRWAQVERGLAQRMSYFSTQLDHLRVQVSKMEQDLMQKNELNTRRLENMLAQQMAQSRQQHSVETKRLQRELDDLRSDMVELLKEMHLLKERTKGLARNRPIGTWRQHRRDAEEGAALQQQRTDMENYPARWASYRELSQLKPNPLERGSSMHYPYHQFSPTAPLRRFTYPDTSSDFYNSSSLRTDSGNQGPPRLIPALPQSNLVLPARDMDPSRSCPSPHYSSRSSSVSGRISITRDENARPDATADATELERRLLEQHRLFWISEGAGNVQNTSPSSRASSLL